MTCSAGDGSPCTGPDITETSHLEPTENLSIPEVTLPCPVVPESTYLDVDWDGAGTSYDVEFLVTLKESTGLVLLQEETDVAVGSVGNVQLPFTVVEGTSYNVFARRLSGESASEWSRCIATRAIPAMDFSEVLNSQYLGVI